MKTVSVIIVNYNAATWIREAVSSVRRQETPQLRVEVIVADNASRPEDRGLLQTIPGIRLLLFDSNQGFSRANNQALEQAHGQYVFFLNPDTLVLPGAIGTLSQYLDRHPDTGAVGPRVWWDTGKTLEIPPTQPLTPGFELAMALAGRFPFVRESFRKRSTRGHLTYWLARAPVETRGLAGANIFTRKEILERVGPFDDATFFLYFEDADWCLRVAQAGYGIAYEPRAEIVHFYNQSAKQEQERAIDLMTASKDKFFRKHYGDASTAWKRRLCRWLQSGGPGHTESGFHQLDGVSPDTRFEAPSGAGNTGFLFQISVSPLMFPAAGAISASPSFRLPPEVFESLGRGAYYAQIVNLTDHRVLGSWQWRKM
ncbi:MAG: glycosyltransferase family 2 protein [Deltaproteobacteria bacterium]|nr:glycosyltransferase family 2 protein [Deltaproteobacteria bacterium]